MEKIRPVSAVGCLTSFVAAKATNSHPASAFFLLTEAAPAGLPGACSWYRKGDGRETCVIRSGGSLRKEMVPVRLSLSSTHPGSSEPILKYWHARMPQL